MKENLTLSIICPVFNEEDNIPFFIEGIQSFFAGKIEKDELEVIFINDGSSDKTWEKILGQSIRHPWIKGLSFSTNAGSHTAIMAGIQRSKGDVCVFIAVDLQDPLENIYPMLDKYNEGYEIVWACRDQNYKRGWKENLFSKVYYFLMRSGGIKQLPPNGASMFLLGTRAVRSVSLFTERNLTLEGMFGIMGFPQGHITYTRRERKFGKSKWTWSKKIKLFLDGTIGFTYFPIRALTVVGFLVAFCSFGYTVFLLLNKVLYNATIPGWSSIMIVMTLLNGMMMIMLGILGEYLWRTLDEIRKRPKFILDDEVNLKENAASTEKVTAELPY